MKVIKIVNPNTGHTSTVNEKVYFENKSLYAPYQPIEAAAKKENKIAFGTTGEDAGDMPKIGKNAGKKKNSPGANINPLRLVSDEQESNISDNE